MKEVLSIIAIILVFVGYAHYINDIRMGASKPHIFSWLIWTFVTAVVFALQIRHGAGPGAWVTLSIAAVSFVVFILSFKSGTKFIAKPDIVLLLLALVAFGLWVFAKQPVASVLLLSTTEMLGFIPTVRKTWNHPYTEPLGFYWLTTFRHGLSILALKEYSVVTWLYPVTWTAANCIFALILLFRRQAVKGK